MENTETKKRYQEVLDALANALLRACNETYLEPDKIAALADIVLYELRETKKT